MAGAYKPIAVFVLVCAAFTICALLFLRDAQPRLRLGERITYGIYVEGARKGSWEMNIEENMAENAPLIRGGAIVWENMHCYKANYTMNYGRVRQGGWMVFDENGKLRHARVWYSLDNIPQWATEIAYFHADNLMYVIRDNYEDNSRKDDWVPMQRETMITEYLWYLLRVEQLRLGYEREFDLNELPDATRRVAAKIKVVREEKTETFAGTFDCWILGGQRAFDWMWVEKNGRLVARMRETSGGQTRVFVLESYG